jgi:hypothetical protein
MSVIESEIKTGTSMQVGNFELTPQTQVLKVQIPGYHAGLVWNRPKAVVVRTPDGQETVLPVTDVTRVAIWAILAGGLLGAILIRLLYWNR